MSAKPSATTPVITPQTRRRHELLAALGTERDSKVVTYILSDRQGANAQIAEDAVRPIYDHLRAIAPAKRIDLFLYSTGGLTDVPWRIVTMIREFAEEFCVLIPYKAMSAATMIALGADEIVMGRKGELGPIDPQLAIQRTGEGGTAVQEQVGVEDIMAYIRFLREKAGLSDQSALVAPVSELAKKLDPRILGQINRAHSHIRSVAGKLLASSTKQTTLGEQRIQAIVDIMAEKTYQHGHAIGRREAAEIGLKIVNPSELIENLMWELQETYEDLCHLREPIDPRAVIPQGQDEHREHLVMGAIESVALSHQFEADLVVRHRRQVPAQLNINLNLNLQLPANLQPQQLPAAVQQAVQQLLQQLQQQAQALIQQEINKQMPIVGYEGWTQAGSWRKIDAWPGLPATAAPAQAIKPSGSGTAAKPIEGAQVKKQNGSAP